MQAVICGCESEEPIGKSSTFEGGLPVSEELGFPENDAWAFITAEQIADYPQPALGNPLLLAEALRTRRMPSQVPQWLATFNGWAAATLASHAALFRAVCCGLPDLAQR